MGAGVPVGQKQNGIAPDCLARDADHIILPVAMDCFDVDIFIGQIDAAGIGGFTIDDHDLPVIAMVHDSVNDGMDPVEGNGINPFLLQ